MPMLRVDKYNLCPVCGRNNWCLRAEDGTAAICARIAKGSVKDCGIAGWLHILSEDFKPQIYTDKKTYTVSVNWNTLIDFYKKRIALTQINLLAKELELHSDTLCQFNIGWNGEAYTFPLINVNNNNEVVGIMRRFIDGSKRLMSNSIGGLYMRPDGILKDSWVFINEGLTDTIMATELRFEAIGRYNCSSNIAEIVEFFKISPKAKPVIIPDNDRPGINGAAKLLEELSQNDIKTRVIHPGTTYKDFSCWCRGEGKDNVKQFLIEELGKGD